MKKTIAPPSHTRQFFQNMGEFDKIDLISRVTGGENDGQEYIGQICQIRNVKETGEFPHGRKYKKQEVV